MQLTNMVFETLDFECQSNSNYLNQFDYNAEKIATDIYLYIPDFAEANFELDQLVPVVQEYLDKH